jgi:hypothetical protein
MDVMIFEQNAFGHPSSSNDPSAHSLHPHPSHTGHSISIRDSSVLRLVHLPLVHDRQSIPPLISAATLYFFFPLP